MNSRRSFIARLLALPIVAKLDPQALVEPTKPKTAIGLLADAWPVRRSPLGRASMGDLAATLNTIYSRDYFKKVVETESAFYAGRQWGG